MRSLEGPWMECDASGSRQQFAVLRRTDPIRFTLARWLLTTPNAVDGYSGDGLCAARQIFRRDMSLIGKLMCGRSAEVGISNFRRDNYLDFSTACNRLCAV